MPSAHDSAQTAFPPFVNQLLQSGYLTLPQVQQALIEQRQSQRSLTEIIETLTGRLLPPEIVNQYRQEQLFNLKILHGLDVFDPEIKPISPSQIESLIQSLIPIEICRRHQIFPLAKQDGEVIVITLAMVNPDRHQILDDLRKILRLNEVQFERKVILKQDYNKLLEQYQQICLPVPRILKEQELETMVDMNDASVEDEPSIQSPRSVPAKSVNTSHPPQPELIVNLVNKIFSKAIEYRASEIYFEPQPENLIVRFRQSGILRIACEPLSKRIADAVVERIKKLAKLDTAPHHLPQQGKLQQVLLGRSVSFLLNTIPSKYGNELRLQVFDPQISLPTLEDLIILEPTRKLVKHLLNRPAGLLILSGCDRQEISTTFYSLLNERNRSEVNITTVENPIERTIHGITQVEIDPEQGRDYITVVESFFKQEADIIGIDRIGNLQTAQAAIEAAMTGHLVITTLSSNDVESALTYLLNLGISPALLSESLIGIIHQRLLRRLCPSCRVSHTPLATEITQLNLSNDLKKLPTLCKATFSKDKDKRCPQCQGLGYWGQIGVYEVLSFSSRLKNLMSQKADVATLKHSAFQDGMKTILSYAQELVLQGETTLEEVERILPEKLGEQFSQEQTQVALTQITEEHLSSNTQKIVERLQEVEKLITTLNREFESLKQELKLSFTPVPLVEQFTVPPTVDEKLPEPQKWETLVKKFVAEQDTMISDGYEELTDPGDWDKLREELEPDKETMVSDLADDDEPSEWTPQYRKIHSVDDPW